MVFVQMLSSSSSSLTIVGHTVPRSSSNTCSIIPCLLCGNFVTEGRACLYTPSYPILQAELKFTAEKLLEFGRIFFNPIQNFCYYKSQHLINSCSEILTRIFQKRYAFVLDVQCSKSDGQAGIRIFCVHVSMTPLNPMCLWCTPSWFLAQRRRNPLSNICSGEQRSEPHPRNQMSDYSHHTLY